MPQEYGVVIDADGKHRQVWSLWNCVLVKVWVILLNTLTWIWKEIALIFIALGMMWIFYLMATIWNFGMWIYVYTQGLKTYNVVLFVLFLWLGTLRVTIVWRKLYDWNGWLRWSVGLGNWCYIPFINSQPVKKTQQIANWPWLNYSNWRIWSGIRRYP